MNQCTSSSRYERSKNIWAIVVCLGLCVAACSNSGTDDVIAPTKVNLVFEHRVGGERIKLDEDVALGETTSLRFKAVRYWVSNVEFVTVEGNVYEVPASYYLVEQTSDKTRVEIELRDLPVGDYTSIRFGIGVDAEKNHHLDSFIGELAAGLDMDWGWNTGFIFFKGEGAFEASGINGTFGFHLGADNLYQVAEYPLNQVLVVHAHVPKTLTFGVDLSVLFTGLSVGEQVSDLPLEDNFLFMGGDEGSIEEAVANNLRKAFVHID